MEEDATLVAALIRGFAGDWLRGARRFAAIFHQALARDQQGRREDELSRRGLADTRGAAPRDEVPDGLSEIDPSEHADDDRIPGLDAQDDTVPVGVGQGRPGRQFRAPGDYTRLLKTLGCAMAAGDVVARYYRERALPHLLPFPRRRTPRVMAPFAEGWEPWVTGEGLEELDVLASVLQSPILVPGVTTVRRVFGEAPGAEPARVPMDLDIYVDCSGSMPKPSVDVSYLALCATILSLSALRAGARVQATLWSSPGVVARTGGFVRDERAVLGMVTGFASGCTSFPLTHLAETWEARKSSDPPAHIVVISDDGADTMLCQDDAVDGPAICAMALKRARGGGTLVLNLTRPWPSGEPLERLGFRIHAVTDWDALVRFAARFVRENYGEGEGR